jgi:hypothetical protein
LAKPTDLPLDPHAGPGVKSEDDHRRIDSFVEECNDMLDQDKYRFAWDTISGMRDTAVSGMVPTPPMWTALRNIREGANRARESLNRWNRRYER